MKGIRREKIREILVKHGFTCREQPDGSFDLNPYVYTAVKAVLEEVGSYVKEAPIPCSIIVAYDMHSRYIGDDNKLPWKLSDDMRRFKALTMDKPIIMGRNTCESLGRKPLPGRTNIVVTRNKDFEAPGFIVMDDLNKAMDMAASLAATQDLREYFVIGGAQIYEQALPRADFVYATEVRSGLTGKCTFPLLKEEEWEASSPWHVALDAYPYVYLTYVRKKV